MNEAGQHRDLLELLARQNSGLLADEERGHLRRILRESAAARQVYQQYMVLVAGLRWEFADRDAEVMPKPLPSKALRSKALQPKSLQSNASARPAVSPVLGFLGGVRDWIQASPRTLVMILGGLLGAYFVVVFALIPLARVAESMRHGESPVNSASRQAQAPVGTLAAGAKVRWSEDRPRPRGAEVRPGQQYKLARGRVELALTGGAHVVIDGPASWQLESDRRLILSVGKLTAYVPPAAIGFAVATPSVEVIDLGTEFGVEVDASGQADVHVLTGAVAVKPTADTGAAPAKSVRLNAGRAIRVRAGETGALPIPFEGPRFQVVELAKARSAAAAAKLPRAEPLGDEIWLSNLFDDPQGTPLADAMGTDTFKAKPGSGTLGVHCVVYGGNSAITIAPHVTFDLGNLGWLSAMPPHLIANDAWTDSNGFGSQGGLRLDGTLMDLNERRSEDGIGMHADALLTFDLDEIRAAGNLEDHTLEFVCDRAGINDTALKQRQLGSVHMVALVSTDTGVRRGLVDGAAVEVTKQAGSWSVTSVIGAPLRAGGPYVAVRIALKPEDKFLTLAATGAGDMIQLDHGVWLGARLEVIRQTQ